MIKHTHAVAALALLMAVLSPPLAAQQAEDIGQHWVHYNTFNTAFLTPEVARAYGIERSGQRSLLNIAVVRKNEAGLDTPVQARVTATASNLAGQRRDLEMREIVDGDAIYYIASFRIHNRERLNFVVEVEPLDGASRRQTLRFQQTFYIEE
jgi:hypothetical protein